MGVAVLLNLTDQLSFEATDPLMNVINAGPLLFYDNLSVIPFPSDESKCQEHVERLVSSMRNMLEARSLSTDDENEKIRVIVTINLTGGAFHPEAPSLVFPAQKVRQFKKTIEDIFKQGNPLLDRFEYIFVFLAGQTNRDIFYQSLAYDGITGGSGLDWFSKDDVNLNNIRDEFFEQLDTPHDEWPLNHASIEDCYKKFNDDLATVVEKIAAKMDKAGVGDEFKRLVKDKLNGIETVGHFSNFDYDDAIISTISQLIGLRVDEFYRNCTFFILRTANTTINLRLRCQTFIASLVQLLATINDNDFNRLLKSNLIQSSARLFMMSSIPDSNTLDIDQFALLKKMVMDYTPCLESARWRHDQKVRFVFYSPKAEDPMTVDAHWHINDKFAAQRQQMYEEFKQSRNVPFFFGKSIGDWNWYKRVLKSAVKILHFEEANDRPYYDVPRRITDNEMDQEDRECTYAELENAFNMLSKDQPQMKKVKDLNIYLKERSKMMDDFGGTIETLKQEMVKLGYFACLMWIGLLSVLGLTVNYAYHFLGYGNTDHPQLIAACFGVASILFVLSALMGRARVKSRIKAVFSEMDNCYNQLQFNMKDYLDGIAMRMRFQNKADIRRKNLDEMKSKLDAFSRHNRQVDLWIKHYQGIVTKLSANDIPDNNTSFSFNEKNFDFENCMPSLPGEIIREFEQKNVKFTVMGTDIKNVTCFVTHFDFVEEG